MKILKLHTIPDAYLKAKEDDVKLIETIFQQTSNSYIIACRKLMLSHLYSTFETNLILSG